MLHSRVKGLANFWDKLYLATRDEETRVGNIYRTIAEQLRKYEEEMAWDGPEAVIAKLMRSLCKCEEIYGMEISNDLYKDFQEIIRLQSKAWKNIFSG